eukprot:1156716-Pelagomonas_calceolata.AAC.5
MSSILAAYLSWLPTYLGCLPILDAYLSWMPIYLGCLMATDPPCTITLHVFSASFSKQNKYVPALKAWLELEPALVAASWSVHGERTPNTWALLTEAAVLHTSKQVGSVCGGRLSRGTACTKHVCIAYKGNRAAHKQASGKRVCGVAVQGYCMHQTRMHCLQRQPCCAQASKCEREEGGVAVQGYRMPNMWALRTEAAVLWTSKQVGSVCVGWWSRGTAHQTPAHCSCRLRASKLVGCKFGVAVQKGSMPSTYTVAAVMASKRGCS